MKSGCLLHFLVMKVIFLVVLCAILVRGQIETRTDGTWKVIGEKVKGLPLNYKVLCNNDRCSCQKEIRFLPDLFYRDCNVWLTARPIFVEAGFACYNFFGPTISAQLVCEYSDPFYDTTTCKVVFTSKSTQILIPLTVFVLVIGTSFITQVYFIIRPRRSQPTLSKFKAALHFHYFKVRHGLNLIYVIFFIWISQKVTTAETCTSIHSASMSLIISLLVVLISMIIEVELSDLMSHPVYLVKRTNLHQQV